ncbi:MAG: helix-turn-helix domain-containing protein [bacterium]|nr:helix-turn-helix domain-containing protein [bacterium]
MKLKEIIEPLIKNAQITNDRLMADLEISKGTFYRWLREDVNQRTFDEVLDIAKLLQVPPAAFLSKEYKQSLNIELTQLMDKIEIYKEHNNLLKDQIEFYKSNFKKNGK